MSINVAIDGPAGAGKSSVAKIVSKKLNYIYVDTGALYRSVGLYCILNGFDTKNTELVIKSLLNIKIRLSFINGEQHVFLNDNDVSEDIRTPEASMAASDVSSVPEVRKYLFNLQKDIAEQNDCVMDGRDIGTVVLPNAQIKIFLTASPESRANRRFKELIEKGIDASFDEILDDINKRDYQDSHREIAPLKPAEDAIYFDNSNYNLEESAQYIINIIRERISENV